MGVHRALKRKMKKVLQNSGSIQVQYINLLTKSCITAQFGLIVSLELFFVHLFKRSLVVEMRSKEKFKLTLLQ